MDPSEGVSMPDLVTFPSLERFGHDSGSRASFPNSAIPSIFNRSRCQLTHFDLCGDLRNGTTDDLISILSDLPTITHFKLQDSYSRRLDDALMSDMLLQGSPQSVPVNSLRWTDCFLALSHWSSWDMKHFRGASFQAWSAPPTLVAVQTYALLQRGRNALLIHFIGGTTFRNSL